jgi:pyruvate dehydrogenase E2 component (dihydrolipoamide acetyltransferase)
MPDVREAPAATELVPFAMPSLGADMDAGTIVEWRITPGADVHRGDVVAVVQTDKSDLDIEVFVDGTVHELIVQPGVKVPVGTVLAMIEPRVVTKLGRAESAPSLPSPPLAALSPVALPPAALPPAAQTPSPPVGPPQPTPALAIPELHSPVLRHLAEQLQVDTSHLHGSGPGGRVTRDDIEHAAPRLSRREIRRVTPRARRLARVRGVDLRTVASVGTITGDVVLRATGSVDAGPAPAVVLKSQPDTGDAMRRAIARQMVKAWQEIPHFHVATRIDVGDAMNDLQRRNEGRVVAARILPAAVLVQAAARAAGDVSGVNGWWRDGAFEPATGVHVGIVVALRTGGLLAPVIHDANLKDLSSVMDDLRDLVTRARSGRLRASEVQGATFTITLLGEGEVETVTPIIHPPQVAILGLGAVINQPWVVGGSIEARPVVHATLAADHRAVDGRIGSQYLTALQHYLGGGTI